MRLDKIEIKHFRLLADVQLLLDEKTTVIVGRNNSGKTSLTELFRRLLADTTPNFRLEDFSLSAHEYFWKAFLAQQEAKAEHEIRKLLPAIEVRLTIIYEKDATSLGVLGECVIDLDVECTSVVLEICFRLKDGGISSFFADLPPLRADESEARQKDAFFRIMRERVPVLFSSSVHAVDPGDLTNSKALDWATLRGVLDSGFITAQRGLDDVTNRERDVLGKIIEVLLKNAMSDSASEKDQLTAKELQTAVKGIQIGIDEGFNEHLQALLPAFSLFGYPGFTDPALRTETTLDVEKLLTNHTKVHYAGINGINLPEAYNGLGTRNLIFILLKLLEFFKTFMAYPTAPCLQLIFIEEPEVHLHPQMQEVFIAQLSQIAAEFSRTFNNGLPWPVQFVVTTHSSHMANKAPFKSMRYFLPKTSESTPNLRSTKIKNLDVELGAKLEENLEFLHKYMTLTRCDLLFADKAVIIEGSSERLLLPKMIEKIDTEQPQAPKLSSQYISVIEVGGAYAHLFFPLVEFLELPTLIITDIDATKKVKSRYIACKVSQGSRTSNPCIHKWFHSTEISPKILLKKTVDEKINSICRLAYEVPELEGAPCGRSFEAAFILANYALFELTEPNEDDAWRRSQGEKKTTFALKYSIEKTNWIVPRYIAEGLRWLAQLNCVSGSQAAPLALDQAILANSPQPIYAADDGN